MLTLLLGVLLSLAVINGLMFAQLPSMVFYPQRTLEASPSDWGMPYEDVYLQTADQLTLHGWYLPTPGARRTLLFLHGNAGNISHRRDSLAIFRQLGLAVFIPDYRGYGRSEGRPDEQGLYRDAAAAWRYLVETRGVRPENIIIFGRSLGGAVAAHLAAQVPAGALILESTLSSTRDVARRVAPLLSRLVVLRYRFDTVGQLAEVACPVLVLHSRTDDVIPFELGDKVFRAAPEPKRFVALQGDHNRGFLLSQPHYRQALATFIEGLGATTAG